MNISIGIFCYTSKTDSLNTECDMDLFSYHIIIIIEASKKDKEYQGWIIHFQVI